MTALVRKSIPIVALLVFAMIIVGGLIRQGDKRREGSFVAMGGIPVRVVAYDRTSARFDQDLQAVEKEVERLEQMFSRHRRNGEIANLNATGRGCIDASPEVLHLLGQAKRWYEKSHGAFDVTVTPLIELWKAAERANAMPDERARAAAAARVGMDKVRFSDTRLCFERDGMAIDLGAIAKGAILDAAAKVMQGRGVRRGLVDAGGDVAAFGEGAFNIGVRDPFSSDRGRLMGVLTMREGGVVTSGDYERFVTIEGQHFSHIIDPKSGNPAQGLASVTIIGPNATDADALATAVSVMGRDRGIDLVRSLPDFGGIMVERRQDDSHVIWCSRGLMPLFELTSGWEERPIPF